MSVVLANRARVQNAPLALPPTSLDPSLLSAIEAVHEMGRQVYQDVDVSALVVPVLSDPDVGKLTTARAYPVPGQL
jgi:hypothetical protein